MSSLLRKLKSQMGFSLAEAMIVVLIVGLTALAFLTLSENQGHFLRRTRQTSARDQLGFFLQGIVRDKSLLLLSARHPKNASLRACLSEPEKGKASTCNFAKRNPLWLVDLTDPNLQKVWTAPPATPAKYDENGQGCDETTKTVCRFEIATEFLPLCENVEQKDCPRPARIIVTSALKQIYSVDQKLTPGVALRPTEVEFGHAFSYNSPPQILGAPKTFHISAARPSHLIPINVSNKDRAQKVYWTLCTSDNPSLTVYCFDIGEEGNSHVQLTIRYGAVNSKAKITLQVANNGSIPNASGYVEIDVVVDPTCIAPWGDVLSEGQTATAFQQQVVSPQEECIGITRTCVNGTFLGSGSFTRCIRRIPIACKAPWGGEVGHGQAIVAYATPTVPFGSLCLSQTRPCDDGNLPGNYANPNCSVEPPLNCTSPWGGKVNHGDAIEAYLVEKTPFGQDCMSVRQVRRCENGVLQGGTASFQFCQQAPPKNCLSPWGTEILHGSMERAYYLGSVAVNQSCMAPNNIEDRRCTNGILSGSFSFRTCSNRPGP